jgi:hypothetical protein
MKIRLGFVSNSSSSSYLVSSFHMTLGIVARGMLNIVMHDFKDGRKGKKILELHKTWSRNLGTALRMKEVKSGKLGITFPSANEDTYIIKKKDNFYIATCRNHQWDLLNEERSYGEDDNEIYQYVEDKFYYNVKNQLIHGHEKYDENHKTLCVKCKYNDGFYVVDKNGIKLCAFCYIPQGKSENKAIEEIKAKDLKNFNPMKYLKIV